MRIGQLADRLGVNPKTIRYYESIGLMPKPERTASGYRFYGEADLERLSFIRAAQRLGLSLEDISEVLTMHEREQPPCGHVLELFRHHIAELDQRVRQLQRLRDELVEVVAGAADLPNGSGTYCSVIEHQADYGARASMPR